MKAWQMMLSITALTQPGLPCHLSRVLRTRLHSCTFTRRAKPPTRPRAAAAWNNGTEGAKTESTSSTSQDSRARGFQENWRWQGYQRSRPVLGGAGDGGLASDMSLEPAVFENTPALYTLISRSQAPTLSFAAAAAVTAAAAAAAGAAGAADAATPHATRAKDEELSGKLRAKEAVLVVCD